MIGWRVGWVVAPEPIMADIALVGMTNVVCQVGIAQQAVAVALWAPDAKADVAAATRIWQGRCETSSRSWTTIRWFIRPAGGRYSSTPAARGDPGAGVGAVVHGRQVAATPMTGWGPGARRT